MLVPPATKTLALDIRDFESLIDFIYAYFEKAKQLDRKWTLAVFAKILALKPSNLTALKSRFYKLNNVTVSRLYKMLDLEKEQTAYFETLLQLYHLEQDAAIVFPPSGMNDFAQLYQNQPEIVAIVQKFSGTHFKNRQGFLDTFRLALKDYWSFNLEDNLMAEVELIKPDIQYLFDKHFANYKALRGSYIGKSVDKAQSKCLTTALDFMVWEYIRFNDGCTLIEIYKNLRTELEFTNEGIEEAIRELCQAHLIRERNLKYYYEEALPSVRINKEQIRRFNRELFNVQQKLISIPQDEKLIAFNLIAIPKGKLEELRTQFLDSYDSILKKFKVTGELDAEYLLLTNLSFFSILKSEEGGK